MRILYIITGLGIGGAEVQLINIINQILSKGYNPNDIKILSLTGDIKIRPPVSVQVLNLKLTKNPLTFLRALRDARKLVFSFMPTVVHAHMFHANIFSRFLRIISPVSYLINTAHSSNEGGRHRMILYKITDVFCDITTNVSDMATTKFFKLGAFKKKKSVTIYNGINTKNFKFSQEARDKIRSQYKISDNQLVLINVGRLVDVKDHANLLHAFQKSKIIRPNLKLFLLGDGPLKASIVALANELSLANDIFFVSHTDHVSDFLSASDFFVLSSKFEGFPLSIVEAILCNCICIMTNNGGQVEAVPTLYPYICPPGNSALLENIIVHATSLSIDERAYISSKCYEKAIKLFSLESISEKWLCLYKQEKTNVN